MAEVPSVNDDNFKGEVLESATPVLVDFWATWCAPCKQMSEILGEFAASCGDKIKVVKLNVDDCPNTATQYGVTAIPTLVIFKDGKEAERMVGVVSKDKLEDKLKAVV